MTNEKVFQMNFGKVYLCLVQKALRKGRTAEEVDTITSWLTGYSIEEIHQKETDDTTYGDFFLLSPCFNPKASFITGSICGVKVESIEDPLMQKIRYLDKLVDELAKGKSMDKILRK